MTFDIPRSLGPMTRLYLPVRVVILTLVIFCDVAMESTITHCVYFEGRRFLLLPLISETPSLADLCIALPFSLPFTHGSTGRTLRHILPPYCTYSLLTLIHYTFHPFHTVMSNHLPTGTSSMVPEPTVVLNPHPSSIPSRLFKDPRREESEVVTAQALMAQFGKEVKFLRLGFRVWPDGTFGCDNTAVVSCHGDESKGFEYSFHVSGAARIYYSRADKDTPSEHALTFAMRMNDVLGNEDEEITKVASYTAGSLGKPLKKGQESPHTRNAAIKLATLLKSYYEAAMSQSTEQAKRWNFRGTDNRIDNIDPTFHPLTQAPGDTSTPSLILPVKLYSTMDRRDFDPFLNQVNESDPTFSTFPIRWTSGTDSLTLLDRDKDAASKTKASKAGRRRRLDKERYAARAADTANWRFNNKTSFGGSADSAPGTATSRQKRGPAESESAPCKLAKTGLTSGVESNGSHSVLDSHLLAAPSAYPGHSVSNTGRVPPTYQADQATNSGPFAYQTPGSTYGTGQFNYEANSYEAGSWSNQISNDVWEPVPPNATMMPQVVSRADLAGYDQFAPGLSSNPARWNLTDFESTDEQQDVPRWPHQ
jgi:hypothetical protein